MRWCSALVACLTVGLTAQTTYSIHGTVTNSATGTAIRRALVQSGSAAVFTDSDGRFELTHLKAGEARVTVRKPGFFGSVRRSVDLPMMATARVQVTADTPALVLTLVPSASFAGRVTGPGDEPLEHVMVRVFRRRIVEGRSQWQPFNGAQTDEEGNYRITGLQPDHYVVAATAQAPVAIPADRKIQAQAFPLQTYFPGVGERDAASVMDLAGGREFQADFSLRKERAFRIAGTIAGAIDASRVSIQLALPDGQQPRIGGRLRDGQFEFPPVPAGDYEVIAQSNDGKRHSSTARQSIHLSADTDHLVLKLSSTLLRLYANVERAEARPSVEVETGEPPFPVDVRFLTSGPSRFGATSKETDAEGKEMLSIFGPPQGRHNIQFDPMEGLYVASAVCGDTDLLRDPLTIAEGAETPPIKVTLRDGTATLKFRFDGGLPDGGATLLIAHDSAPTQTPFTLEVSRQGMLILEPPLLVDPAEMRDTDPPRADVPEANNAANSASNDQRQLTNLAPGDYTIYAFDDLSDLEYAKPDTLLPYSADAVHVHVDRAGSTDVSVKVIRREKK